MLCICIHYMYVYIYIYVYMYIHVCIHTYKQLVCIVYVRLHVWPASRDSSREWSSRPWGFELLHAYIS